MRPPLSAIEPLSDGVSIWMRAPRPSASSRVAAGVIGAVCVGAVVVGGAPGTAGAVGGCLARRLRSLLRLELLALSPLLLILHLRPGIEELPAEHHRHRQHDGNERFF